MSSLLTHFLSLKAFEYGRASDVHRHVATCDQSHSDKMSGIIITPSVPASSSPTSLAYAEWYDEMMEEAILQMLAPADSLKRTCSAVRIDRASNKDFVM